ncbi:MAG: MFS transporter, partial [Chloroflexota bacterium]
GPTPTAGIRGRRTTPPENRAFSWGAFLSTYLPALVLALGTGIALPAIPVLAKSFGVSFGLASGVITAFLFGGTVGTVPTGWLIDRIGRRKVMLAGPLLTSAVALLVMTAHSFPELLIYRFLDGFAAQMWLMGRLAAITDRARADQRGRQVTWMYGMDNVGKLSGPVVGGFVAAAWGVRSPFAAYALLALLALIPTFRYVEDSTPRQRPGTDSSGDVVRLSVAQLVLPRLAMFGVAFFAAMARGPIFADLLHLYAAFAYNLDAKGVGFLATAANLLALPIGFAAGFMLDHIGRKRTIVPGFAGVTVTMLLLAVTAVLGLSLQWYVAVFLAGVAFQALTGGSIQTIATDVAPVSARGMFLGLWRFTSQAGIVVGPVIFAFLADRAGYGSAFVFIAVVALVVTVLLITRVPETGKLAAVPA